MTIHYFQPDHYFNTLGPHEPVLRIKPGDRIATTTIDAHGQDEHGRAVAPGSNPQTGPFYLEGAQPGDTLVVTFERITPNRSHGWSSLKLAGNVLDPGYAPVAPHQPAGEQPETAIWSIDMPNQAVKLQTPTGKLGKLILPLAPFLGCFGVAPAGRQAISTATSGPHGGNMDYRGFVAGTKVYLPVAEPGGLFFLGDGHAVQGDGEIGGTGVEVSMEVIFHIDLISGKTIAWPRGEDDDFIFTIGNARPLDQALQHATTEMLRWLQTDWSFDETSASLLMAQTVEYEVGNVFDPAYTIVCKILKRWLVDSATEITA